MGLYKIDTHYPGSENKSVIVVLYGELGTPEFSKFHTLLKEEAQRGTINYLVRHYVKVIRRDIVFKKSEYFAMFKCNILYVLLRLRNVSIKNLDCLVTVLNYK